MWKAAGKPRSGEVNANRVRIKLKYKNAIKLAAANSDAVFNDELYDRLCKKDTNGFWKSWRKRFHMKNLKPTCTLNGKHGEDNVREEFTQHYKNVYTPNNTSLEAVYKNEVDIILDSSNSSSETIPFIDLDCFVSCVKQLKRNNK